MYRAYKNIAISKAIAKPNPTNKITYYITDIDFVDWCEKINNTNVVKYIAHDKDIPKNSKIIMLSINNQIKYQNDPRAIMKTAINILDMLNDKCKFAMFMMEYYPQYIPPTIYISRIIDNKVITYINESYNDKNVIMISKPAIGCAGNNIKIVSHIDKTQSNIIISEYMHYDEYYSGHLLIINGIIVDQIYFKAYVKPDIKYFIKCGIIENYEILEYTQLKFSTDCFCNIFKQLQYNGIVCIDFMINDNQIIIFEINPRPGGSLIYNTTYCTRFFNKIIENSH